MEKFQRAPSDAFFSDNEGATGERKSRARNEDRRSLTKIFIYNYCSKENGANVKKRIFVIIFIK